VDVQTVEGAFLMELIGDILLGPPGGNQKGLPIVPDGASVLAQEGKLPDLPRRQFIEPKVIVVAVFLYVRLIYRKNRILPIGTDDNIARISIIGVPDKPGLAYKIFSKLSSKGTNVDIILQSIGRNGTKDISFTVEKDRMEDTIELLKEYTEKLGATSLVADDNVSKVSIVGAGMETHPGVAAEPEFHGERLAGFEGLGDDPGVTIEVFRVEALPPALAELLRQAAPGEFQPALVVMDGVTVLVRPPQHEGNHVRKPAEGVAQGRCARLVRHLRSTPSSR